MITRRTPHITPARRKRLQVAILRWYRSNHRTLPWRRTRNPYRILVSEIMLQQTQVSRVKEKYPLFLKRFPTLRSLAQAPASEVIRAWQGMGYNRRAIYLKRIADTVAKHHRGRIPDEAEALLRLPGIGRYTAHAILASAFGRREAVVDTNIRRILRRISGNSALPQEWEVAQSLLPPSSSSEWNQALMDLGALVCIARSPRCTICPLSRDCRSAFQSPSHPISSKKREPSRRGIPNRLHRGKVIERLRSLNGTERISEQALLRSILPFSKSVDIRWFRNLLEKLERDGLVSVESKRNTQYVSLVK